MSHRRSFPRIAAVRFTPASLLACVGSFLLAGCATMGERDRTTIRFHEQVSSVLPEGHFIPAVLPEQGLSLFVSPYSVLTERDVLSADALETANGYALLLRFDPHGTFSLDEITTRIRGQYLVVFLDAVPVAAWLVDKRITNGQFFVQTRLTAEEATAAADSLNAAAKKRR